MQALSSRLNDYLDHLMQLCTQWSEWIAQQEQAVVRVDFSRLIQLTNSADQLLTQITGLHQEREEILSDASQMGISAKSLQEVAQSLTRRSDLSYDLRMRAAQRHIEHLRRLHLAIWVLISHCEHFANETMLIFSRGQVEASVYAATGQADTSGGQLLDTRA